MTAWRYEISLRVSKNNFTSERSERVKYFSTLEEKFRISTRPCNILYFSICCKQNSLFSLLQLENNHVNKSYTENSTQKQ